MHELPLTEQIIKIVTERGQAAGASKIESIKLVVGERSGYITESIRLYFDVVSKGTLCEGAALEIEVVKPMLKCPACDELFERPRMSFACPACGTDGEPTDIGREFYIDSIEVSGLSKFP
ncbi:MAG: hydrogenase maturation nickel metallochaperone HypA [Clostridiales bacterium]|nr:hydrogenase maturation nickel metallochaperone HypA [Clostridiales bacterium]